MLACDAAKEVESSTEPIFHVAGPAVRALFIGRWKLVDAKGTPSSYLTVTPSGAKRDHAPAPGTLVIV